MWIVSLLPLGPAAPHRELSYWSAQPCLEGSIVPMSMRGSASYGLVVRCDPLADKKQDVRNADFTFRKIRIPGVRIFSRHFLRAAFDIAERHATSVGAVIDDLVPQTILESMHMLHDTAFDDGLADGKEAAAKEENMIAPRGARAAHLAAIARETLGMDRSVLVITPTVIEAERVARALSDSLPGAPVLCMHGSLGKKALRNVWRGAATDKPTIAVGTYHALSLPLCRIGVVALERAVSRAYDRDTRPFLHTGVCAEAVAGACGARFITLSPAPRIEDSERCEHSPSTIRATPRDRASVRIIDRRTVRDDDDNTLTTSQTAPRNGFIARAKKPFSVFSDDAREALRHAAACGARTLLLCARRGLATQTVCDDCGDVYACPACGAALVLYEEAGERAYRCPHCKHTQSAKALCRTCGGWRLTPLGIGADRVADEARALLPETPVLIADEKTLRSPRRMAELMARYESSPNAILVGTEGALSHVPHADLIVAVSIDSLLFSPEYAASLRALHILYEARGLSRNLIIQTRVPDHPVMESLRRDDSSAFIEEERRVRETLRYPPYSTLVRLTLTGSATAVAAQKTQIVDALAHLKPQHWSAPRKSVSAGLRGASRGIREHILLRLPADTSTDRRLLSFIRSLPPSIEVRINPPSVLGD